VIVVVYTYQLGGEEAESCPAKFAEGLAGPSPLFPGPLVAAFLPNGEGADEVPWPLVVGRDVKMDGGPHTETEGYEAGRQDAKRASECRLGPPGRCAVRERTRPKNRIHRLPRTPTVASCFVGLRCDDYLASTTGGGDNGAW